MVGGGGGTQNSLHVCQGVRNFVIIKTSLAAAIYHHTGM